MTDLTSPLEPGEVSNTGNVSMRASYKTSFKLTVIQKAVELGSNRKAAEYFGIHEKQVRSWRSASDKLLNAQTMSKRLDGAGRRPLDSSLDNKLLAMITKTRAAGDIVRWTEVQQRARELSCDPRFKASNGWLCGFKLRHGFTATQGRACHSSIDLAYS